MERIEPLDLEALAPDPMDRMDSWMEKVIREINRVCFEINDVVEEINKHKCECDG